MAKCDCCGHEHMELDHAAQRLHDELVDARADIERLTLLVKRLEVPSPEQVAERFAIPPDHSFPDEVEDPLP